MIDEEEIKKALGGLTKLCKFKIDGSTVDIWRSVDAYNLTEVLVQCMEKAGFVITIVTLANEKTTKKAMLPGVYKPMIIFKRKEHLDEIPVIECHCSECIYHVPNKDVCQQVPSINEKGRCAMKSCR